MPPRAIITQSDGGPDEWSRLSLAMDGIDILSGMTPESHRFRLLPCHGHFVADRLAAPVKKMMWGTRKLRAASMTLTEREFFAKLAAISFPGYKTVVIPVTATHDFSHLVESMPPSSGISDIFKLRVSRGTDGQPLLTTWMRAGLVLLLIIISFCSLCSGYY